MRCALSDVAPRCSAHHANASRLVAPGTSDLAACLYDEGWQDVTAVDVSRQAIAAATKRYAETRPGLRFEFGDCRHLTNVSDGSYGAVLDKGTLDACCCGDGFDYEAQRIAAEVARVLTPGGLWCSVSLMPPSVLLPLLPKHVWQSVECEPLHGGRLHFYRGLRSRWGARTTRWHWHPVEGGWHSRVRVGFGLRAAP